MRTSGLLGLVKDGLFEAALLLESLEGRWLRLHAVDQGGFGI